MNKAMLKIIILSAISALALMSGCLYDPPSGTVVITEKVVCQFDEYRTIPTIGSAVVADDFKEKLMSALERQHFKLEDVQTITMVSGAYKVSKPSTAPHDWVITGTVSISRQDDPNGPVTSASPFINVFDQSLRAAKSRPVRANLNTEGVALVNRALAGLLEGMDPRLIITMNSSSIVPPPSTADPLEFKWLAEVTFQAVIKVGAAKK
jgi:hypothetical protein